MLEKINKKKNVNVLSCVQKHDIINTKNLRIVTRQGMKIGNDNPQISKIKEKNVYPDPVKEKKNIKMQQIYLENLLDRKKKMIINRT